MSRRLLSAINDTTLFLQEWIQNPRRTAAVAPSSPRLASAMAKWIPTDPQSYILELGPGTGAVTKALLKRGVHEDRVIAIEKNPNMARVLRKRFQRAHVIVGDAHHIAELLEKHLGIRRVDAVVSSLPFRVFRPEEARQISSQIRAVLKPGGKWIQYSYHLGHEPIEGTTDFKLVSSDVTWLNIPPAKVSVYQK